MLQGKEGVFQIKQEDIEREIENIDRDIQKINQKIECTESEAEKATFRGMIRSLKELKRAILNSRPQKSKEINNKKKEKLESQLVTTMDQIKKSHIRNKKKLPVLYYSFLKRVPNVQIALFGCKDVYISRRAIKNQALVEFVNCKNGNVIPLAKFYYHIRNVRTDKNVVLAKRKQSDQELEIQPGKLDLINYLVRNK